MCLILFAYRTMPAHPLIVAANRDEFHARASREVHFWDDLPGVLAGRDLQAGGTWLGCNRNGRFAALTNFSGPQDPAAPRSRGLLVQNFLTGTDTAEHYAHSLHGPDYAGFNLLLFDGDALVCTSNRGATDVLEPGYYGLSNAELGATWPKCMQGAAALEAALVSDAGDDALFELLANSRVPDDAELPHRGRPVEFERRVAPSFIVGDEYGTRASSVLRMGSNDVRFAEKTWYANGRAGDTVRFSFKSGENT